ncbi:MAG: hypothetical protein AAF090_06155 [Bacteroidota bacterium]
MTKDGHPELDSGSFSMLATDGETRLNERAGQFSMTFSCHF